MSSGVKQSSVYKKLQKIREASTVKLKPCARLRSHLTLASGEQVPLKLRDYQAQMVMHLLMRKRFVVGDDTGCGKTLEMIASICYIWEKEPDVIPVIVTTTSAIRQWAGEFDKFTTGIKCFLVEGGPKKREQVYIDFIKHWSPETPCVLITNYARMRIDNRKIRKVLNGKDYLIAFDEATAIKNVSTTTHTAAARLAADAKRAYGITATLIKNNLTEGFGIYQALIPNLFPSEKGFMYNYCVTRMQPIGKGRRVPVVVGHSKDHIKLFRERIDPYYYGRAKHEVATELPLLTTKEIYTTLSKEQWKHYRQAVEGLLEVNQSHEMIAESSLIDPEQDTAEVEVSHLTQLIYCQEIVNDLYLIGNEGTSAKVDALLDLLENELAHEKVIVFTRFRQMVDRLQSLLADKGYELGIEQQNKAWNPKKVEKGVVRVTGSENSEQRDAARRAFTETEDTNLIFLTMAGAEAMNLQQARVMIFFDLPWSAGDYLQLVGRMIRIGSPHASVYAIHLIAEGPFGESTIDKHVTQTLNKKMTFIEGALGQRLLGAESDDISFGQSDTRSLYEALVASAQEF
jgi:SNF2 family DNA or RNA helicase